jgi:hypothetical protein
LQRHWSMPLVDVEGVSDSSLIGNVSGEVNGCLPPIRRGRRKLIPALLPLPNAKDSVGEKVASMTATTGATPMTPFRRTKEAGGSEAEKLNAEVQDREAEAHLRKEVARKKEVIPPSGRLEVMGSQDA